MSLTVGELTGFVDLNTDGVRRGAAAGEAATARMSRTVLSELRKIENEDAHVELEADGSDLTKEVAAATAKVRGFDGLSATARLKVDADTSGIDYYRDAAGQLRNSLGQFMSEAEKAERGLDGFGSSAGRAGGHTDALRGRVDRLADGLGKLTPVAAGFAGAGLVPILMGTVAAVAATNGALGLLPAVAMSGATGMAALKVGMSGFGDAMSSMDDPAKFAEAVGKLSPEAREAATAVRGLVPAWSAMKTVVQDRLFAGVSEQISGLGRTYIPMLGAAFGTVTGAANGAAMGVAGFLQSGRGVASVNTIVTSGAQVWSNLLGTVSPLVQVLTDIGAVGGPILAELTTGAGWAAMGFANFIAQARQSGQLEAWIRGGVSALGDLFAIVGNVGKLIGSMFRAANMDGAGLLSTVRNLTAGWAQWAASAEGQARMGEVFGALNEILSTTSGVLGTLLPIVADLIVWFSQLPAPVQQAVVGFVVWGSIVGKLLGVLSPLITVVGMLGPKIVGAAAAMVMGAARMGVMGTAASTAAAATNASALSVIGAWIRMAAAATVNAIKTGAAWLWTTGASAATAIATFVATAARFVLQWTLMAAAATANAIRTGAAWLLVNGAGMAMAIARMIATVAVYLAQWVIMAVGAMASAITMAAAWFVALGPIGWVIAAVVALVVLIIANWDTVKAWTLAAWSAVSGAVVAAWEWIKSATLSAIGAVVGFLASCWATVQSAASAAWSFLVGIVSGAVNGVRSVVLSVIAAVVGFLTSAWNGARSMAQSAWSALVSTVSSAIGNVLSFVSSLPGRILGYLGNLGSLLVGSGQALVNGFLSGLQAAWNSVVSFVQQGVQWVRDLFPFSPAKKGPFSGSGYVTHSGKALTGDFAKSLRAGMPGVLSAAREVMNAAHGGLIADAAIESGIRNVMSAAPGPRPMAQVSVGRDEQGGGVHVEIHNPLPERSSSDINRSSRTLAKLGGK